MSKHRPATPRSGAPREGRRFRNPVGQAGRGFLHYLRWVATARRRRWTQAEGAPAQANYLDPVPADAIAATFVGHSTFLLRIGGINILTDPVFSQRVGPFNLGGPRRVRPPGLPFEALPPIHLVLLSHNHYDHADIATLGRLRRRFDPVILTGLGNRRWLRGSGFEKVVEFDWCGHESVAPGVEATFTPAQHFSSRHFFDRDRTLWGGFVVKAGARQIYFAGDSGYGEHFRDIGRHFPEIDLALIPIGAYEPRWFMKLAHVNPEEAVQIHLDVRPRLSVGMHFGTFQLTDEPIDEPPRLLREALRHRGVSPREFVVPEFGETVVFSGDRQSPTSGKAGGLKTGPA